MKVMLLNPPSKHSSNVARDLFYGCWCKGKRIAGQDFPPLNLLYLSAILKKDGHDVIILDSQAEKKDLKAVKKDVDAKSPGVIIIPTSSMNIKEDSGVLKILKKDSKCITMAFGSHTTFYPEQSLGFGGLDYAVQREPEYILKDFVNAYDKGEGYNQTKGIAYMKDGKCIVNENYGFIENLDDMPFPDREYIKDFIYFSPLIKKLPWTTALTSRGCPGRCNFCTTVPFYGHRLRFRSAKSVVDEMEEIKKMGYNEVFFRDETFTAHPRRLIEICRSILERKLKISWICNARIGNLNKKNLRLMKKAGCHMIKIGVETGSQTILDNIKKEITVEQTRKTFRLMNRIGMESHAHMMLGCPGETWDTINETIKFIKEINPTTVTFNAFTLFPGAEIYEEMKKKHPEIEATDHDISKEHSIGFHSKLICSLSDEEVGQAIKKAYKAFYFRPSYVLKTLLRIRSLDEFRRIVSAGFDVLSFSRG